MTRAPLLLVSLAALALFVGCGGEETTSTTGATGTGATTGTGGGSGPTYHKDIAPLLGEKCVGCHVEGKIAPFSLDSYEIAASMAPSIVDATSSRRMPPFAFQDTEECQTRLPIKHDLRLSEEQLALLAAWADAGAPEGDPKDAKPFTPVTTELDRVDADLAPLAPFVTSGDVDQFQCFVLDPKVAKKTYVSGMQVVPGDPAVVHHALTFRAKRSDVESQADANGQFQCFGGTGDLVHAWAPGAVAMELATGVGVPIDSDEVFVMQIHYHPAGSAGASDSTHLQVRYMDETPAYQMLIGLIGNASDAGDGLLPGPGDSGEPEFVIPANASKHTETMTYTVPFLGVDHAKLAMVGTHMHYVGTDMKVDIARVDPTNGDPADECLIQTPQWNFEWQRGYDYEVDVESLPRARAGDTFTMRCTYENTLANPFVAQALADQGLSSPIDVSLGEQTLDEMCLFVLGFLLPAQ